MATSDDQRPPDLPPPPLMDPEALAREAVPRFPDAPLPWVVVAAGLVAGVTGPAFEWLRWPWFVVVRTSRGMAAPPPLSVAQLPGLVGEQALWGVLFALLLVLADRALRRWPRPWRWTVAGGVEGLLFASVVYVPRMLSIAIGSPSALRALLVTTLSFVAPAAMRGLVYGLFARWRRHPGLVFSVAGVASVLVGWPLSLLTTLLQGRSAAQTWSALMSWPWWHLLVMLLTGLASSIVYGAVFGYAIVWAEDRRVAREQRRGGGQV